MALRSLTQHYVIDPAKVSEIDLDESRRKTQEFMSGFVSHYIGDDEELRREAGFTANKK
ncbi:hypothetical protein BOCO_0337 [Bombiscardovia coagulans]|uniref:Uncharacterized protein n=2 Tax=Bombiscardovia coagulans TaxID=686666 RepID=A0A261ESH6_9BIFI|nr:hypothetical protein BOCO_0337 [Bombiscardovia coagulans]